MTKIVAAVVDTHNLTMYQENGEKIVVPQGDPRILPLVEKVIPAIEANGFCEVAPEDLIAPNLYRETEQQLNGFVQFFRMMQSQMTQLLQAFDKSVAPASNVVASCKAGAIPAGSSASASAIAFMTVASIPM